MTITGCKKEEKGTFTITGRVVQNCNDPIPVPGVVVEVMYTGSSTKGNQVFTAGSATTDAEGNFSITYDNIRQDPQNGLRLVSENGFAYRYLLYGIPKNRDLNISDVYFNTEITIIYKFKLAGRSSSVNDTFIFGPSGWPTTLIGPFFENQIIDTIQVFNPAHVYGNTLADYPFAWQPGRNRLSNVHLTSFSLCEKGIVESYVDISQPR
jgi:hypothetical protein